MIEKKLEKKLEEYLKEKKDLFYENSINYVSLRDTKMIDGNMRKLHVVSFMVSISNQKYDSDALYSAAFDENTHNLIFIIGPQSYEKIGD